ncbi:hypothetical protein ASF83_09730 [Plantibacter sp. Leaf171]|nr:hypothetical protein ASE44_09750 [Plantibacter sp. Leaf1]KQR59283.1 hypothetical protein ASF83_09730 [Plantibacter sp. Leaf171]
MSFPSRDAAVRRSSTVAAQGGGVPRLLPTLLHSARGWASMTPDDRGMARAGTAPVALEHASH